MKYEVYARKYGGLVASVYSGKTLTEAVEFMRRMKRVGMRCAMLEGVKTAGPQTRYRVATYKIHEDYKEAGLQWCVNLKSFDNRKEAEKLARKYETGCVTVERPVADLDYLAAQVEELREACEIALTALSFAGGKIRNKVTIELVTAALAHTEPVKEKEAGK